MRKLLSLFRLPETTVERALEARRPTPPEQRTESEWISVRAPGRHRDQTLSDAAVRWLARVPEDARPRALAERFPRIVNRFAALWRDPGLMEHFIDELMRPPRRGRHGFPTDVLAELQMLQALNDQRLGAPAQPRR